MLTDQRREIILITLYALVVIFISWNHEIWRDEMRALNLVIESDSVLDILTNNKKEGHPALWYLMLYYGYHLLNNPIVLKVLSVMAALAAMTILIKWTPFSWLHKVLIVFGYFMVYQYAVISRNYGISMPLLFGICCLYPKRFEKMLPIGALLFLLAHTNAYATIISISFTISLVIEGALCRNGFSDYRVSKAKFLTGILIAVLGVVLFIIYMHPFYNRTGGAFTGDPAATYAKNLLRPFLAPGHYFAQAIGVRSIGFASLAIWTLYGYLMRKPFISLLLFLSISGMGLFHEWFSAPLGINHKGLFTVLIIVVFWLDGANPETVNLKGRIGRISDRLAPYRQSFLTVFLIIQLCDGIMAAKKEIFHQPYSSSKSIGRLVKETPELKDAIMIGEPDVWLESVTYYVDNPIFIPRENRFGRYVDFGPDKRDLSLNELIDIATELKTNHKRPFLLAIGHQLSADGPFSLNAVYSKNFTYDLKSLSVFDKSVIPIASFRKVQREKFDLYLFK